MSAFENAAVSRKPGELVRRGESSGHRGFRQTGGHEEGILGQDSMKGWLLKIIHSLSEGGRTLVVWGGTRPWWKSKSAQHAECL